MKKQLIFGLLVSLLISVPAVPHIVSADDYQEKIDQKAAEITEQQKNIDSQDSKISDLQSKTAAAENEISSLEQEIAQIQKQGEALASEQASLGEEITGLQTDIKELQQKIEKRQSVIDAQARSTQVNSKKSSYVYALLEAESFSDAITRAKGVSTLVKANNQLVASQKADKQQVEKNKENVETKLAKVQANAAELEKQKGTLEGKQTDLTIVKNDLAAQKATEEGKKAEFTAAKEAAEKEKAEQEAAKAAAEQAAREAAERAAQEKAAAEAAQAAQAAALQQQVQQVQQATTTTTSQPAATTPVAATTTPIAPTAGDKSAVIALARQQIGKPYVWGAHGPSSFDCSGLMEYVYTNAGGRYIGGWTVPQESAGTRISVGEAQPGDLYFWGSAGASYHVALAIGGGQYIHAPQPGQNVTIGSVGGFAPSFAVRM